MPTLSFIWGFTVISFLLARRLWLSHKIKRISNSPEYYIEEYEGEVNI
jgi:hypothetical protein